MRNPLRAGLSLCVLVLIPAAVHAQSDPWLVVGRTLQTENVASTPYHRYNLPRSDLRVTMGGVDVGAIALGAWVGFSGPPTNVTMMGDLVVTGSELGPVLAELAEQDIDVTAIHNHLAGETPQVYYVHLYGEGVATELATRVEQVVALTGTPRPVPAARSQPVQIDTAQVFRALGRSGSASGGIARISFQFIDGTVTMNNRAVDPNLGYGTPIVIQMVGENRAVATGDFAVPASLAPRVARALAEGGVTATALHTHLVGESPPLRYIHFWADGPLAEVLSGLRGAIDAAR